MTKIQNYPTTDCPPTDPFEGLVEVYYQLKGFITSSNKWFWVFQDGKKQRGYQDIDVLAINKKETIIVSVTSNLDDKIRRAKSGDINSIKMKKLNQFYRRSRSYLKSVDQYSWLVNPSRRIKKVLVYATNSGLSEKVQKYLLQENIELLSVKEILNFITKTITEYESNGLKSNNQTIKTIQLILRDGKSYI